MHLLNGLSVERQIVCAPYQRGLYINITLFGHTILVLASFGAVGRSLLEANSTFDLSCYLPHVFNYSPELPLLTAMLPLFQRLCEELEYSELLDKAAETDDPYQRMVRHHIRPHQSVKFV